MYDKIFELVLVGIALILISGPLIAWFREYEYAIDYDDKSNHFVWSIADFFGMTGMFTVIVFVFAFFALMIGGFDPKADGDNAMIILVCIGAVIIVCRLIYWWLHFLFGKKREKRNT